MCRAAADGNKAAVELLIDTFGSVNFERYCGDIQGWGEGEISPLNAAIIGSRSAADDAALSHYEIVTLLIKAKANVLSGTWYDGSRYDTVCDGFVSPHYIGDVYVASCFSRSGPIMAALLNATRCDTEELSEYLFRAVGNENIEHVKLLLAHKADPNLHSRKLEEGYRFTCSCKCLYRSCLMSAIASPTTPFEIISSLINAKADVHRIR